MTIKCGMIHSEDEVLRMAAESPFLNPSINEREVNRLERAWFRKG
jgi:hypothetical protein